MFGFGRSVFGPGSASAASAKSQEPTISSCNVRITAEVRLKDQSVARKVFSVQPYSVLDTRTLSPICSGHAFSFAG